MSGISSSIYDDRSTTASGADGTAASFEREARFATFETEPFGRPRVFFTAMGADLIDGLRPTFFATTLVDTGFALAFLATVFFAAALVAAPAALIKNASRS